MLDFTWKENTYRKPYDKYVAVDKNNKKVADIMYNPETKEYILSHSLFKDLTADVMSFHKSLELAQKKFIQIVNNLKSLCNKKDFVWYYPNNNEKAAYLIFEQSSVVVAGISEEQELDDEYEYTGRVIGYSGYFYSCNDDIVIHNDHYEEVKRLVLEKAKKNQDDIILSMMK